MLFPLALTLVGIAAMAFAYWSGVSDTAIGTTIQRLRFAAGIGMLAGVLYAGLSLPTDANPPFSAQPLDAAWLAAGIMTFGVGAGALVLSHYIGQVQPSKQTSLA